MVDMITIPKEEYDLLNYIIGAIDGVANHNYGILPFGLDCAVSSYDDYMEKQDKYYCRITEKGEK